MKLVVSAQEQGLEAKTDGRFGRCRYFTFVDTETMECRSICNEASGAAEGAGVKAAELVINEGADAVVVGNIGPKAMQVLQQSEVKVYMGTDTTVRGIVESFNEGKLQVCPEATTKAHNYYNVGNKTPGFD